MEQVVLTDEFFHPKTKKTSNTFRIIYRSMERNLTNEEIDIIQMKIRHILVDSLHVSLR